MKKTGLKIGSDTKIVFGGNFRYQFFRFNEWISTINLFILSGLVAAENWAKVWPAHAQKLIAVSSVYEASCKVRNTFLKNFLDVHPQPYPMVLCNALKF